MLLEPANRRLLVLRGAALGVETDELERDLEQQPDTRITPIEGQGYSDRGMPYPGWVT